MTSPHELDDRPQSRREWAGWLRSLVLPLGLVIAIVAALLWYDARGSRGDDDGFGVVSLPEAKAPAGLTLGAEKGNVAPDFYLEKLGGGTLRLSDLRGRPVLVNFWASWCVSCRQETPELIRAQEVYAVRGLVVVGVNLQEGEPLAKGFVEEFGIDYPVAMDRRGEVARSWRIGGPTQGLPASYFIDREGVVQKVVWGAVRDRELREGLALILGQD